MAAMTDVAGFIYKEMMKNLDHTASKKIRELLDYGILDALVPGKQSLEIGMAMDIWRSMVGNRRPWDHKLVIKQTFGVWASDAASRRSYKFDIWSNLHYGYIGLSVGFSRWVLLAGAGAAQLKAGTSPPGYWKRRVGSIGDFDFLAAFDDPADQAAIEVGMDLWEDEGRGLTLTRLVGEVRARAGDLATK
jgi:hypothetical protein